MARWTIGEAEIDELLSGGELQKLTGDAANGTLLLAKGVEDVGNGGSAAYEVGR